MHGLRSWQYGCASSVEDDAVPCGVAAAVVPVGDGTPRPGSAPAQAASPASAHVPARAADTKVLRPRPQSPGRRGTAGTTRARSVDAHQLTFQGASSAAPMLASATSHILKPDCPADPVLDMSKTTDGPRLKGSPVTPSDKRLAGVARQRPPVVRCVPDTTPPPPPKGARAA